MHILIVTQYFPPDTGGGSVRIENAVKGLLRRGHKLTVVTTVPHYPDGRKKWFDQKSRDLRGKNIRILRVWVPPYPHWGLIKRLVMYLFYAFASLRFVNSVEQPDVVWSVNPNFFNFIPGSCMVGSSLYQSLLMWMICGQMLSKNLAISGKNF